jgi:hypothetical protein
MADIIPLTLAKLVATGTVFPLENYAIADGDVRSDPLREFLAVPIFMGLA